MAAPRKAPLRAVAEGETKPPVKSVAQAAANGSHRDLLAPLAGYLDDFSVDRNYRVLASPDLQASVYLQGFCENSHGLSDTLLSVLPARAAEIGRALYQDLAQLHGKPQPAVALTRA